MGWNSEAGLDPDTLHLRKGAADEVGKKFATLAHKLEAYKHNFENYHADMGMRGCDEGDSWNEKVQEAAGHVSDAIGKFIDRANEYAARAHATEKACTNTEENNANLFAPVDPHEAFPPVNPRS